MAEASRAASPAEVAGPVARERRRGVAGDALLHPVALVAIATLVVNDQLLKAAAPGLLTGKLSDVAGLVFFPLLLVAAAELVSGTLRRPWRGPSPRAITLAVAFTGLAFAAVKVTPFGEAAYEALLGAAQWPFRAVGGLAGGSGVPPFAQVELTRDPTDLVALAALWIPFEMGLRRARASDHATLAVRPYELLVSVLAIALLGGAILDGWAHTHELLALEAVITPWHAVVYLAFVAVFVVLLAPPAAALLGQGRAAARAAIPDGFGLSLAGLFVFLGFGVADTLWHVLFGIEADAEALLSPTHLGLGLGAALIASGPIRAAWSRAAEPAAWPGFLAPLLAVVAIVGIAAFALHVANPFVDPWPRFAYGRDDPVWYGPHIGVASAIVTTVVLMIPTLLVLERWPDPPAGTMTVLFGAVLGGLTFLHDEAGLVGAPVLGGFIADVALLTLSPARGGWRAAAFAFIAPTALFTAYFVVLRATGPVTWSAHLIGGTIVLAGATGWALWLLTSARRGREVS